MIEFYQARMAAPSNSNLQDDKRPFAPGDTSRSHQTLQTGTFVATHKTLRSVELTRDPFFFYFLAETIQ